MMKRKGWSSVLRLSAVTMLLVTLVSAAGFRAAQANPEVNESTAPHRPVNASSSLTSQIIIKYRPTANLAGASAPNAAGRIQSLSTLAGEALAYVRPMSGGAHVMRLTTRRPVAAVEAIAAKLAALPEVEYAEPDYVMRATFVPNDPSYSAQWHYFEAWSVNAEEAWDITTGSAAIYVAVIDTGITDHPDLAGRWVGGYDFITDVPTANDGNGRDSDAHDPGDWAPAGFCGIGQPAETSSWHGTHVAGTIGAASNNGVGVAGLNWQSPIVPIRVLGRCGGFSSDIADGMRWAAGLTVSGVPANLHPVKVMNLSLGGSGPCGTTFQNAINAVNAVGAIVVVAAGNSNANAANHSPANCNGVVTVAATDRDGNRTFYSNFGSVVEISAPGGETNTSSPSPAPQNGVLSTLNDGLTVPGSPSYAYYQGTSMAAPHVAGVLSLMVSISPTLNFTDSLQILQSTARSFPQRGTCSTSNCGSGIADAAAALNALVSNPATPTSTATGPVASATPTGTQTPISTATATSGRSTPTPPVSATPSATATSTPPSTATVVGPTPTATNTSLPTATFTPSPTRPPRASRTPEVGTVP